MGEFSIINVEIFQVREFEVFKRDRTFQRDSFFKIQALSHCAAKGGDAKGDRSLFSFSVTFWQPLFGHFFVCPLFCLPPFVGR